MRTPSMHAAALATLLWVAPAFAQHLYFSRDNDGAGLYTLSTTTGLATWVGLSGVDYSTVGLSESASPGVLYGSRPSGVTTINADGSGATDIDTSYMYEGLTYDSYAGILYGIWGQASGGFRALNPYDGSVLATLADPGADVEGLAYAREAIYGLAGYFGPRGNLYKYDISGDSWSLVGYTGVEFNEPGLAYDPVADVLYAIGSQDSNLYAIDPDTAQATVIGPTGLDPVGGGLAFVPVPELSGGWAVQAVAALCGSAWLLRRRRLVARS